MFGNRYATGGIHSRDRSFVSDSLQATLPSATSQILPEVFEESKHRTTQVSTSCARQLDADDIFTDNRELLKVYLGKIRKETRNTQERLARTSGVAEQTFL